MTDDEEVKALTDMSTDEILQELADLADAEDEEGEDCESQNQKQLLIQKLDGETTTQAGARSILLPEYQAARSVSDLCQFTNFREADPTELASQLDAQTQKLIGGDLEYLESVLAAQVVTLNTLFHTMIKRSVMNIGQYFDTADRYMKLALRAQSQCTATASKLAEIKRPVIKQTNIAHGHQQVNNFPEKEIPPNELLEETDGERLDPGTTEAAGGKDQTLETVDKKHRAEDD